MKNIVMILFVALLSFVVSSCGNNSKDLVSSNENNLSDGSNTSSYTLNMKIRQTGTDPGSRSYVLLDTTITTNSFYPVFSGQFSTNSVQSTQVYKADLSFQWSGDASTNHLAYYTIAGTTTRLFINGQSSGQIDSTVNLNLSLGTTYNWSMGMDIITGKNNNTSKK